MKKLIIITLLISTLAVTGCGVGTVNSIAPSSSDTVSINTLSDSDILKNAESTNNNDFSGYNIIACEASSADRTISDSLEDISGNSTLVINALIKEVSYEMIQGNAWTKTIVHINEVISGDAKAGEDVMIYSLGGYIPLSEHIKYYNDGFRFDLIETEINNTMLHYVIDGEDDPQAGETHIYCLQKTINGSPLPTEAYERVCGAASQFDITDNGKAVTRNIIQSNENARGTIEKIMYDDFLSYFNE